MGLPSSYEHLVERATELNLYENLVVQLNKDLLYANIELTFDKAIEPIRLKSILQENIYKLIHEQFSKYLNLLYIVDVSERKIKALECQDVLRYSEEVTILILLREWQKVWLKSRK